MCVCAVISNASPTRNATWRSRRAHWKARSSVSRQASPRKWMFSRRTSTSPRQNRPFRRLLRACGKRTINSASAGHPCAGPFGTAEMRHDSRRSAGGHGRDSGEPVAAAARYPPRRTGSRRPCAKIGVAEADFYPAISVSGFLGYSSSQLSKLFYPSSFTGFIIPDYNWKILNYGRLKNNVRAEDARFKEKVLDYQMKVLHAGEEVGERNRGLLAIPGTSPVPGGKRPGRRPLRRVGPRAIPGGNHRL